MILSHRICLAEQPSIQSGVFQESRFPPILIECSIALIPLLAALGMIVVDALTPETAQALVLLLFLSSISVLAVRLRRGITMGSLAGLTLVAGFVFWYSYPAFVSHFLPDYELDQEVYLFVDAEMITWSIVYLSLFFLFGVATSLVLSSTRTSQASGRSSSVTPDGYFIIMFSVAACLTGIVSYFVLGGNLSTIINGIMESRAIDKPWRHTENLGNLVSAFTYVTSSAMISGACLLWSATIDRQISSWARYAVWIVAFVITVTIYFDHGTRSIFALVLLPYLSMWILALWRRSRIYSFIVFLVLMTIVVVLLQFQMLYRADYTRSEIYDLLFQEWFTLGDTIDYFKEMVFSVRLVPSEHEYFHESVFLQFLFSPIPRFVWADKPASELVWFYTLSRWNIDIYAQSGNTLPGVVGQYYMSWGWLGPIIVGSLFGFASARLDALLSKIDLEADPYTSSLGIMLVVWIFISYRLLSPGFLYPVIGSAVIVLLSRRRRRVVNAYDAEAQVGNPSEIIGLMAFRSK